MQLSCNDHHLTIDLENHERLWAFHLSRSLLIPLSQITQVSTELPEGEWRELRAPGTFLPGVIKAGTYYTPRGREFWYVVKTDHYLVLDIQDEYYKRVVLSLEDSSEVWAEQIRARSAQIGRE
jgi:hypothetical protein